MVRFPCGLWVPSYACRPQPNIAAAFFSARATSRAFAAADLVLVNDDDLTYCSVRLDDESQLASALAEAETLVEKAHQVCPYSNATRGNVDVRLTVV